jgi:hypothetical protein
MNYQAIKKLSTQGLINILSGHDHVVMSSMESREELEGCLQCNIDEDLIDEIEIILELNAEI